MLLIYTNNNSIKKILKLKVFILNVYIFLLQIFENVYSTNKHAYNKVTIAEHNSLYCYGNVE